jgi:hypothetical protein
MGDLMKVRNRHEISACVPASALCHWGCCDFGENYIVMLPGEFEAAQKAGIYTGHLRIIDNDYFGGKRVQCAAQNRVTCDGGLRPFDCWAYPAFPRSGVNNGVMRYILGAKCPLATAYPAQILLHLAKVAKEIQRRIEKDPAIAPFLGHVQMVGYTPEKTVEINRTVLPAPAHMPLITLQPQMACMGCRP